MGDAGPDRPEDGRALWIVGAGRAELRRSVAPVPTPETCRVRSLFGAISRGTERLVFQGAVPESEDERMRAPLQEGDFPFPVKYGYSAVGTVEGGPDPLRGRVVFCLHPHQDLFAAPRAALRLVPEDVPPERAVLAPFMETALNVVWDAAIAPGDHVAVIGAGLIGSLVAYLAARVPGTEVTLVDTAEARLGRLAGWGCRLRPPDGAPADQDVVVHASGQPEGLAAALDCAGVEARVVEASWFGTRPVALPLGGAFHARRLSIVSSQVGRIPADRRARWTTERRLDAALRLLADPVLDRLFSGESAFSRLDRDYAAILADPDTLCHRIRYAD
ncbi:dehydrogenase [Aureimonas flava]|uniref:Dehydrogenase n=1 Tax=Aureimonas flava TaxID=2320271 RepID=A0A3A1WL48_9HYPH|nr:zinc-binding alcohol dehydrogenase [Aureimonas flava]RIY02018.1 dehydrogenase [Aureimonas flava]